MGKFWMNVKIVGSSSELSIVSDNLEFMAFDKIATSDYLNELLSLENLENRLNCIILVNTG